MTRSSKDRYLLPTYPMFSQTSVFMITFWSYVSMHLVRKSFSVIKPSLIELKFFDSNIYTSQSQMCGLIDTSFMLSYAIGLFISGPMADNINLRIFIFWGMFLSALTSALFGIAGLLDIRNVFFYCILWTVNGLIQSSGFPGNISVLGNWFGESGRGTVLGFWQASGSLGNIAGAAFCSYILITFESKTLSWKLCMIFSACILIIAAMPVLLCLVPHPRDAGLPDPNFRARVKGSHANSTVVTYQSMEESLPNSTDDNNEINETICSRLMTAWMTPGVAQYAISNACLKGVTYSLLFWLPFYLANSIGSFTNSEAGFYSMLFDIGSILGGFATGYIVDVVGYKSVVVVTMILIASICIGLLYNASNTDDIAIILLVLGFFIGGPASLISACIATDLGHTCKKSLLATVTGIIDGTGSIGAAALQYTIGALTTCVTSDTDKSRSTNSRGQAFKTHNHGTTTLLSLADLNRLECIQRGLMDSLRASTITYCKRERSYPHDARLQHHATNLHGAQWGL
eukprot:gene9717-20204_t